MHVNMRFVNAWMVAPPKYLHEVHGVHDVSMVEYLQYKGLTPAPLAEAVLRCGTYGM